MGKSIAVVGTGFSSETAIIESLKDAVFEDDVVSIEWPSHGVPESVEVVLGYFLDNEIECKVYYRDGQVLPRELMESATCSPTKVRYTLDSMLKEADQILYLWDDDENTKQQPPLIDYVMDNMPEGVKILELTNGLAPIVGVDEPSGEPAPVEEEVEAEDTDFTREELEIMTAYSVKRYGERKGCVAKTKSGIIDELFGVSTPPQTVAPEPADEPEVAGDTTTETVVSHNGNVSEFIDVLNRFVDKYQDSLEYEMASAYLDLARLHMLKAISH